MLTFKETKELLESRGLKTIALQSDTSTGCLLIAPDLSARIMAVSMDGPDDENFGFVKPEAITNRGKDPQFNAYGGALRWWVGPEGGQYGFAFPPGTTDFSLSSWRISEEYNGKRFAVTYPREDAATSALMDAEINIENAAGTSFCVGVTCRVCVLEDPAQTGEKRIKNLRKPDQEQVKHLGYLSETTFENLSSTPMRRETGLVSIWLLGMYVAGPKIHVIAPFGRKGTGKIVTDTYFNPAGIGSERLVIDEKRGYMLFRADSKERSKIGLSRSRASTTIGSIDLSRNLLTVWSFPIRRRMPYVNSLWEQQKLPYSGDVSNSYNDDGKFGDFYELECSSHALALKPKERFAFPLEVHHYSGNSKALLRLANKLFDRKIDWERLGLTPS